ncbi:MAG: hypothetical protein KA788_13460 [Lacunisphaera sp.]|nr:hypothetical protein [Lacunisphaera sp.]
MSTQKRLTLGETAPPPDALEQALGEAIGCAMLEAPHCDGRLYAAEARAALAICRAHFAGLARAHGAAIRARISITDDDATAARFEQRALVAHAIAEIIEGKST